MRLLNSLFAAAMTAAAMAATPAYAGDEHQSFAAAAAADPTAEHLSHDAARYFAGHQDEHRSWGDDDHARWTGGDDGFHHHVSAVPEPGTWALMAGGMLIVGAVARRRARR